jgi:hypothetical protein
MKPQELFEQKPWKLGKPKASQRTNSQKPDMAAVLVCAFPNNSCAIPISLQKCKQQASRIASA